MPHFCQHLWKKKASATQIFKAVAVGLWENANAIQESSAIAARRRIYGLAVLTFLARCCGDKASGEHPAEYVIAHRGVVLANHGLPFFLMISNCSGFRASRALKHQNFKRASLFLFAQTEDPCCCFSSTICYVSLPPYSYFRRGDNQCCCTFYLFLHRFYFLRFVGVYPYPV